ncbi:hypothetical protein EJB05_12559, partial [Eragrostis curvula]
MAHSTASISGGGVVRPRLVLREALALFDAIPPVMLLLGVEPPIPTSPGAVGDVSGDVGGGGIAHRRDKPPLACRPILMRGEASRTQRPDQESHPRRPSWGRLRPWDGGPFVSRGRDQLFDFRELVVVSVARATEGKFICIL